MAYRLEIVQTAEKDFRKLPQEIQSRLRKKVLQLRDDPRPDGAVRLHNSPYHRIRVGAYRAIYEIDDNLKLIMILAIGHRKDIYRWGK